ncbi:MAG: transcription-repair coupling factor [Desulfopila sp.]|jgi:transcription-repair coupling factor (superfamily II helicase)|nr:transcription-repair coupling factor [Desulfopila sp.]
MPLFSPNNIKTSARHELSVSGLRGSSQAWYCSQLTDDFVCCCIVPDEHQIAPFEEDMRLFTSKEILTYPGYEIPPYTPLSPDQQTTSTRLSTLFSLQERRSNPLVVTSVEALMRRVLPRRILSSRAELVMAGEETDQQDLIALLISSGYSQVALVRSVGDFSVRGGIIDIYPPPFLLENNAFHSGPIRLDFFGDTVESLRSFDIFTQRSQMELREAVILPVNDIIYDRGLSTCPADTIRNFQRESQQSGWDKEQTDVLLERLKTVGRFAGAEFFLPLFYPQDTPPTDTVFDFLPDDAVIVMIDPSSCRQTVDLVFERIEANYQEARNGDLPALAPNQLFLDNTSIAEELQRFKRVLLTDFEIDSPHHQSQTTTNHSLLRQNIAAERRQRGLLAPLADQLLEWRNQGDGIAICCRSTRHTKNLAELLSKRGHEIETVSPPLHLDLITPDKPLLICDHPLQQGFSLPDRKIHILSESELFGEMRLGSKQKKRGKTEDALQFAELNHGDIIVHRDHGLGIYKGLATIELQGTRNDFMLIEYRDGDKLYLPVDRMNLVSRYEGLSDKKPRIDKLGAQAWKTTTSKIKKEVWKVAEELLDIYANRELRKGTCFSPPGELYHELEESFPYDETPGQDKAISDVINDLTSIKAMDRLVCGDVGYGKTEVAIRGAFKVVEDGYQVAVLVPTTVLAEQHMTTFRERLQGFPVVVECINRFRTPAQQRAILKDLSHGRIDIIIGTHRLLSKDVAYKNLGLLIVDEEHRFGVAHKEKIKKIKTEVDILTLTATPIPRTLQMSLLGIRDLSVISSPPEHRQPVKTFVARFDDLVIKEAIAKEIRRNGQTFVVHNRIKSIGKMAAKIQKLVPRARVAVAHGQMAGKDLENIMVQFVNKQIDVLISTTIIESGLDIPTANTIIINRADTLGLAEIYQLRGRVGRSSLQSFAYLLVPSVDALSRDSKERLRALMDYNELGGGFKLAMSDLQIRGGGNLLGVSQSGHIAAIGYDLYLDLLQKTVADLKARTANGADREERDDLDPEINLHLSAYIPADYIPDTGQRYIAYRRISALATSTEDHFQDLQDELIDRYGTIPAECANLLTIVTLKKSLCALRVSKLEQGKDSLVFTFLEDTPLQTGPLLEYVAGPTGKGKKAAARLLPDGRLMCFVDQRLQIDILQACRTILNDLLKLTNY